MSFIQIGLQNIFHQRTDGGIVRISVPINNKKSKMQGLIEARKIADDYLSSFVPILFSLTQSIKSFSKTLIKSDNDLT